MHAMMIIDAVCAVTFELFEVVKDCVIGGNLSFGGAMKAHQSALIDALYGLNLLFTTCLSFCLIQSKDLCLDLRFHRENRPCVAAVP
jgi:hypothetical protein